MATRLGVDGGGTFPDLTIERPKNPPSSLAGGRPGRHAFSCTGCPLRPVTTASTIRPALLELDGVTAVEIEGSRISAEAEARIAAAFAQL
jgi:hypothetical protein